MATSKKAAKKKSSKTSLNEDSKASKLKLMKEPKKAAAKKDKKEKSEPLSEFQNTNLTGRENGKQKGGLEGVIQPVVTKSLTITSVKINKKDELVVGISKIESDGSTVDDTQTFKGRTAHPDLKAAFAALRPHLALLCDYISTQQIKDIKHYNADQVEKFIVRAVSMNGEGFVISGHKLTKSGKAVGLNTPYTLIEEDEKSKYKYMDDLEEKAAALLEEVKAYQSGEKCGEPKQPEFAFDAAEKEDEGTGEENMEVAEVSENGEQHDEFVEDVNE